MSGPLSRGLRIQNLTNTITDLDIQNAEIFLAYTDSDVTLNFTNLADKRFRIVIYNTDFNDHFISFTNDSSFNFINQNDIMIRLRNATSGVQVQIYEFIIDSTNSNIYCLAPLRLDAIWAP